MSKYLKSKLILFFLNLFLLQVARLGDLQEKKSVTILNFFNYIFLVGSSTKKKGNAGYWASSNVDEEEKQPGLRDKKYEGYSNLKGTHEQA